MTYPDTHWRSTGNPYAFVPPRRDLVRHHAGVEALGRAIAGSGRLEAPLADLVLAGARTLTLPALWPVLTGEQKLGDPASAEVCRAVHRLNGERNAELLAEVETIARALAAAGIHAAALKGVAHLATRLWQDPAGRVVGDIDLLVPPGTAERAATILRDTLGARPVSPDPSPRAGHHQHLPPLVLPRGVAAIEIHTLPVHVPVRHVLTAEEVFREARSVHLGAASLLVPCPTHAAVIAALHGPLGHRSFDLHPRDALDLVFLSRLAADPVDWEGFARRLAHHDLRFLAALTRDGVERLSGRAPAIPCVGRRARLGARTRRSLASIPLALKLRHLGRGVAAAVRFTVQSAEGRRHVASMLANPRAWQAVVGLFIQGGRGRPRRDGTGVRRRADSGALRPPGDALLAEAGTRPHDTR